MWVQALFLLLSLLAGVVQAQPSVGLFSIVDGEVSLTRESSRFLVSEGVRIVADDIVESAPQAKLARIEFSDGVILDIGPATRVLMTPKFASERRSGRTAKLYVLQGWAKITVPKDLAGATFASERFDLTGISRDVVLNVEPTASAVFAESGELTLFERTHGKAGAAMKLKSGEFLARVGNAKSVLAQRPATDFVGRAPRAFLDTLPTRAALFAARDVPAKRLPPIAYADVQAWVDAEAALRPLFVTRWKELAQGPDFRKQLVSGLRAHPEWDRTLFPEKYLPKPEGAASSSYR